MNSNNHTPKGIIIYESKYGATLQYAQWLSEELKLPVVSPGEITSNQLEKFDFLVMGTPVYMGRFRLKSWLKKEIKNICHKKLFLFVVNATSPQEQLKREQFILDSVPAEIRHSAAYFFLPGRVIHQKLSFYDKLMINLGSRLEKDPKKKLAMRSDMDGVKKENLEPLLTAVNNYCFVKRPQITVK